MAKGETKTPPRGPTCEVPDRTVEVCVPRYLYQYAMALGIEAKGECALLLDLEAEGWDGKDFKVKVTDAFFPKQEATSASVEVDEQAQIDWMEEKGKWPGSEGFDGFPIWGLLHTHPGMGAFWSNVDYDTLVCNNLGPGLLVNIVIDPMKDEMLGRVDSSVKADGWGEKLFWTRGIKSRFWVEEPYYPGLAERVTKDVKENWTPMKPKYRVIRAGGQGGTKEYERSWPFHYSDWPEGSETPEVEKITKKDTSYAGFVTMSDLAFVAGEEMVVELGHLEAKVKYAEMVARSSYFNAEFRRWFFAVFPGVSLDMLRPWNPSQSKIMTLKPKKKIA